MKKILKILLYPAVIVAMSVAALWLYARYLDAEIARLYAQKEDALSLVTGNPIKDKGNIWIKTAADNGCIFVMGSSELTSSTPQCIRYNFPNPDYGGNISCVGHASVQNGLHAMDLGANYKDIKDTDIVIIQSYQWFCGAEISVDGYFGNFSELQFYGFLHNPTISYSNKKYLCKRFLDLESQRTTYLDNDAIKEITDSSAVLNFWGVTDWLARHGWLTMVDVDYDFPQTHFLASMYASENPLMKALYHATRPIYYIRYKLMLLKDKHNTLDFLKTLDGGYEKPLFSADWDAQIAKAQSDGEAACTNNAIYVYDDYWTKYIESNWAGAKGISAGQSALESKEWDDFRFLLSVCNELGLHPYLINVSTNAYYYDYVGVDPDARQEYYAKLAQVADEYGIDTYDELKTKEYEPYVFQDVMHLGWKGWIYVTKAVTEYFR